MRWREFFLGGYVVSVAERDRLRAIALWMRLAISSREESRCRFLLPVFFYKRVKAAAEREGIGLTLEGRRGIIALLIAVFGRHGAVLGAAVACLLVAFSSSLVWRVEIEGNECLGTREIKAVLGEAGVREGARHKSLDENAAEAALQLALPEVAWASVYRRGTTVYVKLRERSAGSVPSAHDAPAHLVAATDAIVREIHSVHGQVVTERGRVVRKGDLLISGIVAGAHSDRLLSAEGEVIGEVGGEITVRIPYAQTENLPISQKTGRFQIIFFGKTINIFQNTGNFTPSYGTIIEERGIELGRHLALPITLRSERWVEYESTEVRLSREEAYAYANATLQRRIAETVGEGELILKSITEQSDGEGCTLSCRIVYTKNIAERQKILAP